MTEKTFGRYIIKTKLGQGGMGSVYHAYDPNFRREVALKLLDRRLLHDLKFRRRFEREAQAVAKIDHPGIVPIYDFGEDEGSLFLVMPLMEGGTLGKRLENGPLSLAEATDILRQIAPALDMTHRLNMVHRDLKPDNILFDAYGVPRIADFGIVKSAESSMTLTAGGLVGTPAYMSPEQVSSKKSIDGRSDIYSLGIILFQMLTGQRPFDADASLALALKHVMEQPPDILEVNPALPEGCRTIMHKALHKEPDQRYQTAAALLADLENVESLAALPAEAGTSSQPILPDLGLQPEPELRPAAPRRWPIFAALGVLVLLGGTIFWLLNNGQNQPLPTATVAALVALPATATTTATAVPPTATTIPTQTAVPATLAPGITPTAAPTATPTATLAPVAVPLSAGNLGSLSEVARLVGSMETLHHVAVSPDGTQLAAATSAGIALFQLPDFAPQGVLVEGEVREIAWSPDGRLLAGSASNQTISVWNSADGSPVNQLPGSATALAWSPDSTQLLVGSASGQVQLWPINQAEPAASWNDHTAAISQLAWSPDGLAFASGSASSSIWFRSMDGTGEERNSFRQNGVHGLAWSPDGSRLATAGVDGTVRLETVSNGQLQTVSCGGGGDPLAIVWLDDETVATGSEDGRLRLCSINERTPQLTFGRQAAVGQLFWLAESGQLLSLGGRDGTVVLWNRADGSAVGVLNRYTQYALASSVTWSPDSTRLAVGTNEGTILVWDVAAQAVLAVLGGHEGGVGMVAWSPDGALIASNGRTEAGVRVWEAETGRLVQSFSGHGGTVTAVSWSPDGTVVASSSHDMTLRLWDVASGEQIRPFPVNSLGQVLFVARSPNGEEMVATGQTGLVQLRPPDHLRLSVTLNWHDALVTAAAWRGDSGAFATGDNTGRILLWSFPTTADDVPVLDWNVQVSVRSLAFSADDTILAAVLAGSGRFYDASSGEPIDAALTLHPRSGNLAWSPDGLSVAGVGSEGLVRVWQVLEERP
ncbi:MAG: serine/threonine protein kinase [Anaerolineaceae bacterium]|nr:serine/threonine protein kinase [Anaerolineaceae bacterium]